MAVPTLSTILTPLLLESPMEPEVAPRVFCDMDGVVANFQAGMSRFYGLDTQPEIKKFLSTKNIWHKVAKEHPGLFSQLPMMPDARVLMNGLILMRDQGYIRLAMLSAIPDEWYADQALRDKSRADKSYWVARNFAGIDERSVIVCRRRDKVTFAIKQRSLKNRAPVLIDDYKKNITEWHKVGKGIGILHTDARSSLRELHEYIRAIEGDQPLS